jgi:hypothetical protein
VKEKKEKPVKDIASKRWPLIKWDDKPMQGLLQLRDEVELQALNAINWYYEKKVSKNGWSRWLRFWALTYTVLGGLVPVLTATGVFAFLFKRFLHTTKGKDLLIADLHFNQFGYVLIGIAAGCVAYERFFRLLH